METMSLLEVRGRAVRLEGAGRSLSHEGIGKHAPASDYNDEHDTDEIVADEFRVWRAFSGLQHAGVLVSHTRHP